MKRTPAEILAEYGPFERLDDIGGVTFDGHRVWFAAGNRLNALDPGTNEIVRSIDTPADAGTAFDGQHLFQIAEAVIRKIDPASGEVVKSIPAPGGGGDSGLAWSDGSLWVGHHRERKIYEVDPDTGAVLRSIESDRFVTGVSWVEGELWHGTWDEQGSDIRRIDPTSGNVLEAVDMPAGAGVSGLESDGGDGFYCGGGGSATIRLVRRPARTANDD